MKNKKQNTISLVCYYFVCVLLNNFIMNLLLYFVFKRNDIIFTVQFSEKYILLSTVIAIHIPLVYNGCKKGMDNLLIKYFELLRNAIGKLKTKIIKSKIYKNIVSYVKKNEKCLKINFLFLVLIIIQFLFFDIMIRISIDHQINFYPVYMLTPNILTVAYGLLCGIVLMILPKIISNIFVVIIYLFNLVLFIVNYMLIVIKSEAFTVYNFQIANEGLTYINFILEEINITFIVIILLSIILFVFTIMKLKDVTCNLKWSKKAGVFLIAVFLFFIMRFCGVGILRDYQTDDGWEDITYPKYYTENLINSRKNVSVLGLYEYTLKDIIEYFKDNDVYGSEEEIEEIVNSSNDTNENEMTGIFEGKNLIMVMMESIDNVIIDEEGMPTLSKMMSEGWNFTKRYNHFNAGGSTIATEYATLSGLYYSSNNKYDSNTYNEAIPSIFSKENYIVSSFHENSGAYYNRSELHKSLGFENSYFLYDMDLENILYYEDAQFFDNDELYDLVVPKDRDEPFMSFITTISAHGPYTNNGFCDAEGITDENSCIKYLSKRTDDMLASMLERLEEDGLLDDTVIILYSDHAAYSYNYTEEELSNTYQNIDGDYSIKNLPFVIYNAGIEAKEYDDIIVNDIDFVPTILNLFGIDYDARYYVGTDIFSENHKNICIFSDYTWYDGEIYSVNGEDTDYYREISNYIQERLNFSQMLISNNYYKKIRND